MNSSEKSSGNTDDSFFISPMTNDMNKDREIPIKLLLTNARSLAPKILSLHDYFEEHDIDIAMITESWLKDGEILDRDVIDLEHGSGLQIIYKNRPKKGASARRVGGGVSIICSRARCCFRERKMTGNKFELVAAIGRVGKVQRQIAIFCVYIEPRTKIAELSELNELLRREILQLKAKGNPIIFLGGDLNHRQLDDAVHDYADIVRQNFDPTRGNACLDVLFSNIQMSPLTWPPLETRDGVKSDHSCVVFSGSIPQERNFVWERKTTRKHTQQAVTEFGRRMDATDWDAILLADGDGNPDDMIKALEKHVQTATDELFPLQTVRKRSNEPEWVSNGIRRLSKQKKRVYKREGKSNLWFSLSDRIQTQLEANKERFVAKATEAGPRAFYNGIRKLAAKTQPQEWSLMDMFPNMSKEEAGEEAASYFTAISDLFEPLPDNHEAPMQLRAPVSLLEVQKALKKAKKPSSAVDGDVLPRLMKAHHSKFAKPAMLIFNSIFSTGKWPARWKEETVVVIPKTSNPDSLSNCRNISCTAFLSKVLESILLADIRKEIASDPCQYGGLEKCSVDHLLVDLIDKTLAPLEEGGASVVLGIDFEKAFNRLDHRECVKQLEVLGASPAAVALVRSFLTGRTMRVRIGKHLSAPRTLKGGSPQGSILGCLLYCLTTQQISGKAATCAGARHRPDPADPPPQPSPPSPASPPATDQSPGMLLLGRQETSPAGTLPSPPPPPPGSDEAQEGNLVALETFKYIDDTTTVEAVPPGQGIRHITTNRTLETIPADLTEDAINGIIDRAGEIGMVVNCKKTQLMCVSADNGCHTTASIRENSGVAINSVDSMKLLGFMLSSEPGVASHVLHLKKKFRAKFWGLIHLRQAGIKGKRLYRLYCSLVRPVLECNSVVFHSMLTRTQANELEKLHRQVIRLCFGFEASTDHHIRQHSLKTLEERRHTALRKFTAKMLNNSRFKAKWLIPRPDDEHGLRNRRPFLEKKARTARYFNSPLLVIQRTANDIFTSRTTE